MLPCPPNRVSPITVYQFSLCPSLQFWCLCLCHYSTQLIPLLRDLICRWANLLPRLSLSVSMEYPPPFSVSWRVQDLPTHYHLSSSLILPWSNSSVALRRVLPWSDRASASLLATSLLLFLNETLPLGCPRPLRFCSHFFRCPASSGQPHKKNSPQPTFLIIFLDSFPCLVCWRIPPYLPFKIPPYPSSYKVA